MALLPLVAELALVVGTMLTTAALAIVGPRPIVRALANPRWRVSAVFPPTGALIVVLLARWGTRDFFYDLTWRVFGINITPTIDKFESTIFPENPVFVLQSFQSSELTTALSFVYIYGYAFLIVFPAVAYFALDEERMESLSTLLRAFTANYAIGLTCYILFIAYGPRNYHHLVEGLLYIDHSGYSHLTHTVNQNINVFPSLHTSLAVTVFLLAWRTRHEYPLWVPVAGVLAFAVALSTMYLGIHWFSDVVAGVLLAVASVHIATNYTVEDILDRVSAGLHAAVERARGASRY